MTRTRDILLASAGLLLTSPLFLVVAVAIRIDSPGPVFFRQTRVGKDGKLFSIHKFRSMHTAEVGPSVSTTRDPRITTVGRVLRSSKIDELPQLIDVLRGDMSIVGPRPEVPEYVSLWPSELRPIILSIRPGITDPATVLLRNEGSVLECSADPVRTYVEILLPLKAEAYARYAQTRTFLGDVGIIAGTLKAIVAQPAPPESADSIRLP